MADVDHFVDAKKEIASMCSMGCAEYQVTGQEDSLGYISRVSKGTRIHMTIKRQRLLKSQRISSFYLNLSYRYLY